MTSPEAQLLAAIEAGHPDITQHSAWLDLFLKLAQPRIEEILQFLNQWSQNSDHSPTPRILKLTEELSGLCSEQSSLGMAQLAISIRDTLLRTSGRNLSVTQKNGLTKAAKELLRQLHQHAARV